MAVRRFPALLVTLFLMSASHATPHVIPDDVTIQAFAKPDGARLHLLVRVPFNALADILFPTGARGELDLAQSEPLLPRAATTWISDWVDLFEDGTLLPKPQLVEARVSLASDNSFASYEEAWAHVTGARLPANVLVYQDQALLDVLFDYPTRSDRSSFSIHSRLARLGGKVSTTLEFLPAKGAMHGFAYQGDPGLFQLDPRWGQTVLRFVPLGFMEILKGADYLLFLFCAALLFRSFRVLLPFMLAFAFAHSITLIASAYNLAPDAIWFPVLFETLIALSVLYMALENIFAGTAAGYRWTIAAGFGLIYGFGFSFGLRQALQFGGSHALASILSFLTGVELAQACVLALLVPALGLLFRLGIPERIGTIFLAALAAHTGWHRMLDRAKWLSNVQWQWPSFDPALIGNALRWLVIWLIVAAAVYFALGLRLRARRARAEH